MRRLRPCRGLLACLIGLFAVPACLGETIVVPPVQITALSHSFSPANPPTFPQAVAHDGVTFPSGPGTFSGPGFTASIGTGDEVLVRFQAPPGQRFSVHVPPSASSMSLALDARWATGTPDGGSQFVQGTVTWIGLVGPAPTQTFAQDGMFNNGQQLKVNHQFNVTAPFAFEALEIRIPVSLVLADVSRTYGSVFSTSAPSFAGSALGASLTDSTVMDFEAASVLFTWNACTGNWNQGSNWLPGGGTPASIDIVQFTQLPSCDKIVSFPGVQSVLSCDIQGTNVTLQSFGGLNFTGPEPNLEVGTQVNASLTLSNFVVTATGTQLGTAGDGRGRLTLNSSTFTTGSMSVFGRGAGSDAAGLPVHVGPGSTLTTGHPVIGGEDAGFDVQAGGAWFALGDVSLIGEEHDANQKPLIVPMGLVHIDGTLFMDCGKIDLVANSMQFEAGAINLGFTGPERADITVSGTEASLVTGVGAGPADVLIGPYGEIAVDTGGTWTHNLSVVVEGGGRLGLTGINSLITIDENLTLLAGSELSSAKIGVGGQQPDAICVLGELRIESNATIGSMLSTIRVFPGGRIRLMNVTEGLFDLPPLLLDGGTLSVDGAIDVPAGTTIGITTQSVTGRFNVHNLPGFPDARVARIVYDPVGAATGIYQVALVVETLPDLLDFDPGESTPVAGAPVHAAAGDLDGDGFVDLAVAVPDVNPALPGSVYVLLNDGVSGGVWQGFSAGVQISTGVDPRAVAIGNFDNSALGGGLSNLDIAVACAGDDNVRIYANSGAAAFSEASGSPIATGDAPSDVEAAHMNADGKIDLIVANRGSDTVQVFTNTGSLLETVASFSLRGFFAAGDEPVDVDPVDLDNDKDLDIIVANFGSGTVSYSTNDGTGSPSTAASTGAGAGPVGIAAGDLDGNSAADVVSANQTGDTLSVLTNTGSPAFGLVNAGNVPGGDGPRSVAIADVDGDGDLDVALVTTDAQTSQRVVRVFQNNTTAGNPITLAAAADLGSGAQPVYVLDGDVNNDGREDVIVVEQGAANLVALAAESGVTVYLNTTVASCPGDANGDGHVNGADLSVLLANFGSSAPTGLNGDLNLDHQVNGADLSVLLSNFGSAC